MSEEQVHLIRENCADEFCNGFQSANDTSNARYSLFSEALRTNIIDFTGAGIGGLQKLVNLLISHFLAKVGEDCWGDAVSGDRA